MKTEATINKLLYVPFNNDYKVPENIKKLLTTEEFFEYCFLKPDFDEKIRAMLSGSHEEISAFEIDVNLANMINQIKKRQDDEEDLYNWIESKQTDLYCIKGDAGAGKSTYLHYLKYKYQNSPIEWHIIDIQQAIPEIQIFGNNIKFRDFSSLYSKAISALIRNMSEDIFKYDNDNKLDIISTSKRLEQITSNYHHLFSGRPQRTLISNLFKKLYITCKNPLMKIRKEYMCALCARELSNFFISIMNDDALLDYERFSVVLETFIAYIHCIHTTDRYMLAFDNFERFIGTDEIHNSQLTEFVSRLRETQKAISANNRHLSGHYQILILMRNTSVRMFTSLQVSELFAHALDLSDWFEASIIFQKKIEWYQSKNIKISNYNRLHDILTDTGLSGETFRGLYFKISMLFNYNKRVISDFLIKTLDSPLNARYIEEYDRFWNGTTNLSKPLSKFAGRSIIYRLILNELRSDGFFQNIVVENNSNKKSSQTKNKSVPEPRSLGYARKILTILYDYKNERPNDSYIALVDIIAKIYNNYKNTKKRFLSNGNKPKREIISQVLYYMNYYDVRKDNWLQFIDIQYNLSDSKYKIETCDKLQKLIEQHFDDIRIRITTAGIAYLYFVVYYFEYFSCKSIHTEIHKKYFQENDMPPLLCTIPSITDLKNNTIDSLTCMKIIKVVSHEAIECIKKINKSAFNSIPFKYNNHTDSISHQQRIVNSHRGYLDNYIECLRHFYGREADNDEVLKNKLNRLIKEILSVRNQYSATIQ